MILLGLLCPFLLFIIASAAPEVNSGDSTVIPRTDKQYIASFGSPNEGPVTGVIEFRSNGDKAGVTVNLNLSFKDSSHGPFMYHVHMKPVLEDGNCTATGGHFDPFKPKEPRLACDPGNPVACEVGDLSGKHARIPQYPDGSITATASYKDMFISLNPENAAFIGGRSIVIHNSNTGAERIACANLVAS